MASLLIGGAVVAGLGYLTYRAIPADTVSLALLGVFVKTHLRSINRNNTTAADLFEERLRKTPDAEFIVFEGLSYSYAEIDAIANRVARWAVARGLHTGEVVALLMENRPEFIATWLGFAKLGVTIALMNTNLRDRSLQATLNEANPRLVVVGTELLGAVAPMQLPVGASTWQFQGAHGTPAPADAPAANDLDAALKTQDPIMAHKESQALRTGLSCRHPLFYIYTSGTTGLPKAATFHHARFGGAVGLGHCLGIRPHDRLYMTLPLYHSAGGCIGVASCIYHGATLILRRKFSASNFWKDCYESKATVVQYIGELCRYLCNTPEGEFDTKHSVRLACGNGLRPDVWKVFQARFNIPDIGEFYAATEGNVVLFNSFNRVGAIGYLPTLIKPLLPTRIVKFDVEKEEPLRVGGRLVECGPDEVGEAIGFINQKDPMQEFHGYTNKKATQKKIIHNAFRDGDSWFRTGDLLVRDANGFIFFKDRIGDTFRWKGENVATSEVAEVFSEVHQVSSVNVYGVAVAGHDGRCGMAAIQTIGGLEDLDLSEIYGRVATLPPYARPYFIRWIPEGAMATTGTFKLRKVDLVREGYDLATVTDPIFFIDNGAKTFRLFTPELATALAAGKLRV